MLSQQTYLKRLEEDAPEARCVVRAKHTTSQGVPLAVICREGNTEMDRVAPSTMIVGTFPDGAPDRGGIDSFVQEARALAKAQQGRWRSMGINFPVGLVSYMPVVVTRYAGEDARAWAAKKQGLMFPVVVDLADQTITHWRRAIIAAADAANFKLMVDGLLRPVLVYE